MLLSVIMAYVIDLAKRLRFKSHSFSIKNILSIDEWMIFIGNLQFFMISMYFRKIITCLKIHL